MQLRICVGMERAKNYAIHKQNALRDVLRSCEVARIGQSMPSKYRESGRKKCCFAIPLAVV